MASHIALPVDLDEEWRAYATQEGRTLAEVLRTALRQYLDAKAA